MGVWRIVTGMYGEEEQWVPSFLGDWPADEEPHSIAVSLGVIPQPCPECGGDLTRRNMCPARARNERIRERHRKLVAQHERDHLPPPPPPTGLEPEVAYWNYTIFHRAAGHRFTTLYRGAPYRGYQEGE